MKHRIKYILLAMAITFGTIYVQASTSAKSNFIVQALSTNQEFAQNTSQDLLLRDGDNGSTYLYVEQQQGAILAVFDVTNPEHMKLTAFARVEARGTYDFVTPIGGSAELISFHDGSGTAVLDFHKAKAPRMTMIEGSASVPTKILGNSGYLSSGHHAIPTASVPLDIQLVEINQTPRLLATITGVTTQTTRSETGTIFLLGEGKITVIRQIDAEREYEFQQAVNKN